MNALVDTEGNSWTPSASSASAISFLEEISERVKILHTTGISGLRACVGPPNWRTNS